MQTLIDVQARIAEIIAENGEDTKRSCYYTDVYAEHHGEVDDENGELLPGIDLNAVKPHCIVGNILWQDGIRGERLVECENKAAFAVIPQVVPGVYEEEAISYFGILQGWQDAGLTWGQAKQMTDYGLGPHNIEPRQWWDTPESWAIRPEQCLNWLREQIEDDERSINGF